MGRDFRGPRASAAVLAERGVSRDAPDRLAHADADPREPHQVRSGAPYPRLGGPAPSAAGRPAMLRVFPSVAASRAVDLHGARVDGGVECARAAAPRFGLARSRREVAQLRRVLFDLQLSRWPPW